MVLLFADGSPWPPPWAIPDIPGAVPKEGLDASDLSKLEALEVLDVFDLAKIFARGLETEVETGVAH